MTGELHNLSHGKAELITITYQQRLEVCYIVSQKQQLIPTPVLVDLKLSAGCGESFREVAKVKALK